MKKISFFIDESGSSNPRVVSSTCYIVCGCRIKEEKRSELRIKADQIKFKYWGKTNIVFHSREIGRKEGDFKILKESTTFKNFKNDLMNFLNTGGYSVFACVVDRDEAVKQNWNSDKVLKETSDVIIQNFLLSLLGSKNTKGSIVIESATSEKDFIYHKVLSHYLSRGLINPATSFKNVQDVLTEISFVTKKNLDIEEQIADLMAYGAKLKFQGKPKSKLTAYNKSLLSIFESKLYRVDSRVGKDRRKYLTKIDSYKKLP